MSKTMQAGDWIIREGPEMIPLLEAVISKYPYRDRRTVQ